MPRSTSQARPFADPLAEEMLATLEANCQAHGIALHGIGSGRQGIVHVLSPEQGIVLPGLTLVAPDSQTCTQGKRKKEGGQRKGTASAAARPAAPPTHCPA